MILVIIYKQVGKINIYVYVYIRIYVPMLYLKGTYYHMNQYNLAIYKKK